MKKFLSKLSILSLALFTLNNANAQLGTWTKLTNAAPDYNQGVMLLMTDGTVMCFSSTGGGGGPTSQWCKLTPDAHGSYINGTWTQVASNAYSHLFFSSQVLPSGKLYIAGGEYGSGGTEGEVYDPVANTWTTCGAMVGSDDVYDGNSELLYNGNVLEGPQEPYPSENMMIWNPAGIGTYTAAPTAPYSHDEAAWLKLPDSTVLYVGIYSNNAIRYQPKTNTWLTDNTTPNNMYDQWGEESGAALQLPNGKDIFFGSSKYNNIYTPSGISTTKGTWTAAANMPTIQGTLVGQVDAPSAMMVNGHILLAASPENTGSLITQQFYSPIYFLEYDYTTNTFTQIQKSIPSIGGDSVAGVPCNFATFLNLPDGNILFGIEQESVNSYWVYTPGSGAIPQGKPTIDAIQWRACNTYEAIGKLFNGISEGASFGDDWQMSTNYPLVRLTNGTNVWYAKTTNWNRIGFVAGQNVASDSLVDSVSFALPASIPAGETDTLYVVVNGFKSNPTLFTTLGSSIASQTNIACHGGAGGSATANTAVGGVAPYTYAWAPGGSTNLTISSLSAGTYTLTVTDHRGCTATTGVTITQPSAFSTSISAKHNLTCNGNNSGSITASPSGGTAPYTYLWTPSSITSALASNLSVGTYTVTTTDNHGCTSTNSATITEPTVLSVVTTFVNDSGTGGCNGHALATASGGTPAYTYSWSPGNGTNDTISGKCAGSYCCTIKDKNGCSTSVCVTIGAAGVSNINNSSLINIYPDPNNGSFTVSGILWGQVIELYNDLGQRVSSTVAAKTSMNFDISSKPDGIYLVRILNRDGSLVTEKKIIKAQ